MAPIYAAIWSFFTLRLTTGLGTFLLDQFLIEAGAYSSEDSRPAPRKTFDVIKYSPLLAEVPALVGPLKMSKVIGATLRQFRRLAEDGVFVPRTNLSTIKSPWRLEDGISFINELNDKAIQISMDDCEWELIQKAQLRTGMSIGSIIGFIPEDTLRIALREGMSRYKNLCVNKHEFDELVTDSPGGKEKEPQYPDGVVSTASAFGRSIGMRNNEAFVRLVRAGYTPASYTKISKAGKKRYYVLEEDIAAFHQQYLTQNTMAVEFNTFWRTLITRLQGAGVKPFTSGGEEYGHLYLRADVEEVFRNS